MLKFPPLSLYIHIPWCRKKCPYCDFNSHQLLRERGQYQRYIDHLLIDLDSDLHLVRDREISTIFIGGGTPSLLSTKAVKVLLDGIRSRVQTIKNLEITIEANPDSLEVNRFQNYKMAGVNRISIGIQSFKDKQLARLGRIHSGEEARRSVHLATSLNPDSLNLDLMYGLPGQLLQDALDDLNQAISLNPPHISWYQLTIEPNTMFSSRPPMLPNEDVLWDMFQQGHQLLMDTGYQQYEISSYTKGGYPCQHNLNYWRFGDYLGIGCGAHGKVTLDKGKILRTVKTKHPNGFMKGIYIDTAREVAASDLPLEFFMNRCRLLEGIPREDFINYTGISEDFIRSKLNEAIIKGYLKETNQYWEVTEQGKLFLNTLLELFLVDKSSKNI